MSYPLSPDERAAVGRCLVSIRKQLQDVSELFATRYGQDSSIAELALKTLVSSTLLEHELSVLEGDGAVPESKVARAAAPSQSIA